MSKRTYNTVFAYGLGGYAVLIADQARAYRIAAATLDALAGRAEGVAVGVVPGPGGWVVSVETTVEAHEREARRALSGAARPWVIRKLGGAWLTPAGEWSACESDAAPFATMEEAEAAGARLTERIFLDRRPSVTS